MDAYIEFRNVVKKFDDFVALDHVSLQIPPRERELMQAMRRVFDPTGIMNPGKAF